MYQIAHNGVVVGDVKIEKKGLFYCFYCRCSLPESGVFRVTVTNGGKTHDLGIFTPTDGNYTCLARIPSKSFCGNEFIFELVDSAKVITVLISEGNTFQYLESLNTACLHQTNGRSAIIINPIQDQQGNDRNPIYPNI